MSTSCSSCAQFVEGQGPQPGLCVKEQTDIKGGRFWTTRPTGEKKVECRDFVARSSEPGLTPGSRT
ncbi:MAG TPA: benzylsuccinate synthase gamma subunit family protein [Bacillota bacterium]